MPSNHPNLNDIAFKYLNAYPNKPTIIFLHDSLGCIELWRDFPQQLGELTQCNVLAYDRQGYGQSGPFAYEKRTNDYIEWEADILAELLNYWQIDNAILFGHSDGGSIALITAAKSPEKIAAVITEGAHIFVEDLTVNGIKEAIALYETTDLKAKLSQYHGDKTDAMFWAWAGTWTTTEFSSWNMEHFLPKIQCPALIIQGEDDEYGTLHQVEQIVSQTSGQATPLILPGVKHTPHKEVPQLVLEKVAEFVKAL